MRTLSTQYRNQKDRVELVHRRMCVGGRPICVNTTSVLRAPRSDANLPGSDITHSDLWAYRPYLLLDKYTYKSRILFYI